jgi:predicted amidohydrolase YtcJ
LLDAGTELVLESDAPVAPLDPWTGIAAAVDPRTS